MSVKVPLGHERCPECQGHKTVDCDHCDGFGTVTCPECKGQGSFEIQVQTCRAMYWNMLSEPFTLERCDRPLKPFYRFSLCPEHELQDDWQRAREKART